MSRIDLVPRGVGVKDLGDVAELVRGNGMPKTDLTDEGVGAIHYGQIYTRYGVWATSTLSFVPADTAARLTKVSPGDIIITNTSENVEDVGKAVAWLGDDAIVTGGHATVIKHGEDPKFLAYWFQSPSFRAQKRALATGTKVIDVSAKQLAKVKIPVPPLEVQREIVRILDHFSELEAELEAELKAELEARRRQYAYYRDELLAFHGSEEVSWLPMGELGSFTRGRRFVKADMVAEGIPSIHYGEIYTHYATSAQVARSRVRTDLAGQLRYAKPGDVVIASVGETVADVAKAVAWLGDTEVAIHDDSFAFRSDADPTFIAHVMQTAGFHAQKTQYVAQGKVKRVGGENLGKIVIPVPPLKEQQRIVGILEKFDAVAKGLSIALPAELRARRQQYEYYRDKLLTFPEAAA